MSKKTGAFEKVEAKTKRGGKRPNSGRKKGTPNKKTAAVIAAVEEGGITPLEYMLDLMREPEPKREIDEDAGLFVARYVGWRDRAFEAAKAAAPYVHPRLAAVEHSGGLDIGLRNRSDAELDADIQRAAAEAETAIGVARKGATSKA